MKKITLLALLALAGAVPALADTVRLKDGTEVSGTIIKWTAETVMIENETGMTAHKMADVLTIEKSGVVEKLEVAAEPVQSAPSSAAESEYFSRVPSHWVRQPQSKTPGLEAYKNGLDGDKLVAIAIYPETSEGSPMELAKFTTSPLGRMVTGSETLSQPEQKGRYVKFAICPNPKKAKNRVLEQYYFSYKPNIILSVAAVASSKEGLDAERGAIEDFLESCKF